MADESYWTYRASTPTPTAPPEGSKLTLKDWHSLSPGMRREIARTAKKEAPVNSVAPVSFASLRADFEAASDRFEALVSERFPGADKYTWYRALSAVKGENCRRNDDTSRDAAMATDTDIARAHDEFIRLLHIFYVTRDGPNGFLGAQKEIPGNSK